MRVAPLLLLVAFAVALAGCRDGDDAGTPTPSPAVTATSIALTPPLEAVLADVAGLRGLAPSPEVRVAAVRREEVAQLVERLLTDDDRRAFERATTLYRLLGYMGPRDDYEALYRSFAAAAFRGLYDPGSNTLWLVADDAELTSPGPETKVTSAHEFVHALQDALVDIPAYLRRIDGDLDATLAWAALVEGDAATHEGLWLAAAGIAPSLAPAGPAGGSQAGTPAAVEREIRFAYEAGLTWVRGVRAARGTAGIDALLREPPRYTSLVLHPELAGDPAWRPATVTLPDLSNALGRGLRRVAAGGFGEFQLRNYLQQGIPALQAATATAGWYGDRYELYASGSESAVVLRVVFRDGAAAQAFADAHQALLAAQGARKNASGSISVTEYQGGRAVATADPSGSEVAFVIGSSADVARRGLQELAGR